jgi:PPOX class probable F420-dependent enzyme
MQTMTSDEYHRFMLETARTGKLATVRADGRPHIAPIWFDLDGDVLVFTTWHTTVKAANLRRDPRVSLCVDDEKPPFAYVIVEGTAEFADPTPEERLYWATRIARRYMGDALAESYGKRNGVEGELLVRLTPTKIIAQKGIAD